jgi:aminodeoxyfutalosine synthase
VKSHWIMVSPAVSQVALHFGVDDLEGTVVREKIYHAVGAKTSQAMSLDGLLGLIRGAGKTPAERDSFYRVLRTFDGPGAGEPADATALAGAA